MYHSVKAVFQSPANVLVTRLPYGGGSGATVADNSSVQVYPVVPRPQMVDLSDSSLNTVYNSTKTVLWWDGGNDLDTPSDFHTADPGDSSVSTSGTLKEALVAACNKTGAGSVGGNTLSGIWTESGAGDATPEWNDYTLAGQNLSLIHI